MPSYDQLTLADLVSATGAASKRRSFNTDVIAIRRYKGQQRFIYICRSHESYSNPGGHVVSFTFPTTPLTSDLLKSTSLTPMNRRARVHCSCEAWQMWGSAWNATTEGYRMHGQMPRADGQGGYGRETTIEKRPPNVRDPKRENKVCKHVISVTAHLSGMTFKSLFREFSVDTGSRKATLAPILASYMSRQGLDDSEVSDVIDKTTEDNIDTICADQGLLVPDSSQLPHQASCLLTFAMLAEKSSPFPHK